jgi:hypothetical protein
MSTLTGTSSARVRQTLAIVHAKVLVNHGADETCQVLPVEVGGMVFDFEFHDPSRKFIRDIVGIFRALILKSPEHLRHPSLGQKSETASTHVHAKEEAWAYFDSKKETALSENWSQQKRATWLFS